MENSSELQTGTLEDFCLELVEDTHSLECVDQYISCLNAKGMEIKFLHKSKLHAYLSGNNKFVGLKVGQAAKAGAWNWKHPKLQLFKNLIQNM